MAGFDGNGGSSGELVSIVIVCGSSSATTRVGGAVFEHIGISGKRTITTRGQDGSGEDFVGLTGTSTVNVSFRNGLGLVGWLCVVIGTCTAGIVSIMLSMADCGGSGAAFDVLVSTGTVTAPYSATIKVSGAVCAHIGISGKRITTTVQVVGF